MSDLTLTKLIDSAISAQNSVDQGYGWLALISEAVVFTHTIEAYAGLSSLTPKIQGDQQRP